MKQSKLIAGWLAVTVLGAGLIGAGCESQPETASSETTTTEAAPATGAEAGATAEGDNMMGPPAPGPEAESASAAKADLYNADKLVKTDSGLKYEEVKEGTGPSPKSGQYVKVHYTGNLEDGTKFDSSRDRGEPFVFNIGTSQVIKGWDEGVMSMKVGGQRKLVVPADLGYGDRGAPPVIPPGATLVFDVELLEVSDTPIQ
ncbi:MAG: hypothetical protein OHK0029_00060 [Armatimonadaceae bacterium]